jgi:hypothetical protein
MMNRAGVAVIAGTLFAASVAAQTQSGAQAGAQASSQTNVESNKQGAQASTSGSASATGVVQPGQNSSALASDSTFNATLSAPLDSKKCKQGDPVTARSSEPARSDGKPMFPKGTKFVGHVTEASARAKGDSESAIAILFDKAILKNGEEVPVNLGIQAIASAQSSALATGSEIDTMGSMGGSAAGSGSAGGRGVLGGASSTAGGAVGTVTNTAANVGGVTGGTVNSATNVTGSIAGTSKGAVGGLNAAGQLTSNSQGVFGLNGLNLGSTASNGAQGSVITSAGKNVHLDSGTRMLLVSQAQAGAAGDSKQPKSQKTEPKSEPKSRSEKPDQR